MDVHEGDVSLFKHASDIGHVDTLCSVHQCIIIIIIIISVRLRCGGGVAILSEGEFYAF